MRNSEFRMQTAGCRFGSAIMIRRGATRVEVIVGTIAVLLIIAVLLPLAQRRSIESKRSTCSANLRSLGQSLHIYAIDRQGYFPTDTFIREYDESDPNHGGG